MKTPVATYRVQLNREFDFFKVEDILSYLSQLGISHIYASPIFETPVGSSHGYAVTDPNHINDELGGIDGFNNLTDKAASYGIRWIQDIVPNHMAYTPRNRMILDIMKQGSDSRYHGFFDVDWNYPLKKLKGKILAPFLQDSYRKCLQTQQIRLAYRNGFTAKYLEMEFPLKTSTYGKILSNAKRQLLSEKNHINLQKKLQRQHVSDKTTRELINAAIKVYDDDPSLLDEVLSSQIFALAHWKEALRHINYRRFFDIIDLICVRAEKINVFEETHRLILKLVAEGKISGLRIDHVDGLHDPREHLERLRKRALDAYIIVEKILMNEEELPDSWQVEGTTGYDFLNVLNEVFVEKNNETEFDEIYVQFAGKRKDFDKLVYECKKLVIRRQFSGDVENLTYLLMKALRKRSYGAKCTFRKLREALIELISSFPVYRTYLTKKNAEENDLANLKSALSIAKHSNKEAVAELDVFERLFDESSYAQDAQDALQFIMRLQQFTGPIMAKGLEDTAFYVYNRFISLNEVGSSPKTFGCSVEHFHAFNQARLAKWPASMNSTATHDTKRGEDVRARLNVLSEIPFQWRVQVKRWADLNRHKKRNLKGKLVPDKNEEYYIYQTLTAAFPFDSAELPIFMDRLKAHVVKAIREAKINSSWLNPDLRYEEAAKAFLADLFEHNAQNDFQEAFIPFQKKIASHGFVNSLSQTLLKITCPGVPDFYQGTELWDLNMVDPDNRRPVDFEKRKRFLKEVLNLKSGSVQILLRNSEDGKIKLYEIHKSLKCRRMNKELFEQGEYIPLTVKGAHKNHVISFCRKRNNAFAVIIVPRFLAGLNKTNGIATTIDWKDTFVCLPQEAPRSWRDVLTEKTVSSSNSRHGEGMYIKELLDTFPTALLLSGDSYS